VFEQRQGGGTVLRLGVPSIEQVEIGKKWRPQAAVFDVP